MDITKVYAITIGGSVGLLLLINGLLFIAGLARYLSPLISKHLIYRYVLDRHRFVGPWSRAHIFVQLIYIAGNICCFRFQDTTISQVELRAGALAIINLILLFAVPHLGTLADLLSVTIRTFRQIHRSTGDGSYTHHLLRVDYNSPAALLHFKPPRNKFAVTVSSFLAIFLR